MYLYHSSFVVCHRSSTIHHFAMRISKSVLRHLTFFSSCYCCMIICIFLGPAKEDNWLSMIIATNTFDQELMHYSLMHLCVALIFFYGSEVLRYIFLHQLNISDRWWPAACAGFVFYLSREIRDREKLHYWDIPGLFVPCGGIALLFIILTINETCGKRLCNRADEEERVHIIEMKSVDVEPPPIGKVTGS